VPQDRLSDNISVSVKPDTRNALEDICEDRLCSLSEQARKYIEEGIKRDHIPT
jgi:hypothetical protein